MSRQIEVLAGRHLVAGSGGVIVVVAHRLETAVTADSIAARTMTALLDIVGQAASNEPRRSGRTVARLATNWLMGLANGDEDAVEFGVITPGDSGIAVFLHGGVSAVLAGAERSQVLRGREAGFTVDRVVMPGPEVGAGLFVDEVGREVETLPARGVFGLGDGTVPGAGAVLWFAGADVSPVESPVAESQPASEPALDLRKSDESSYAATMLDAGSGSAPVVSRPEPAEVPVASPVSGPRPVVDVPPARVVVSKTSAESAAEDVPARSPSVTPAESMPHASAAPPHGPAAGSPRPTPASHTGPQPQETPYPGTEQPSDRPSDSGPLASVHEFAPDHDYRPPADEARTPVDLDETRIASALTSRILDTDPPEPGPGVVIKGFKCARDHLNDPRVSFCAVCGIRMDQLTCVLTDGVRPPLGVLLLDDGTSFVLDNDCVLGREPEHAEAVVSRGARPVRLEDRSGGMSRAHAEIRLIDWDVTVVDGGSTNGTHVRQPAHQDWTRAIPGHPVKLTPGAQVQLGSRVVTFDSQHGQL
ncbi:FHA domain-containing protein [Nocardia altamirensis]|uniref:FHA domain-containing protein n=1 Tax=Nocardia altamirensis TaxID=472158 RepID=UPI00083FFC25|nr:FHA domain-containing protein [Nocardia altamirensis]